MAFDSLQEKLTKAFRNLQGKGKLSRRNMEDTLQEIRIALLEADVNYRVATEFLNIISAKALGQDVLNAVDPAQQLIKIVNDQMVKLLGPEDSTLSLKNKQNIVMIVGLQGSGKTTQIAKIANSLKKEGRHPLLVADDVIRPAAIEQLKSLGQQIDVEVFSLGTGVDALTTVKKAIAYAKDKDFDVIMIDTAGRLQIDETLMRELQNIKDYTKPNEILLTVDAMTGQDICNVAKTFHDRLNITGLVVTKFDGDAKGGAVLSVKAVTGVPVKYVGVGEKINDLEAFHPERVAQRILGMGDIVSLVEKAQEEMDVKKANEVAARMAKGRYTLDDMLISIEQSSKLGSISNILGMIPGMSNLKNQINEDDAQKSLKKTKAIIQSMTKEERENPSSLRGTHKKRIAAGSGTSVDDVNRVINQYEKTKKVVKQMSSLKRFMK